ncbi:protein-tyrosine-phosphatase [Arthrobacter crystallopoietes BAB-32]|uniref:Protein-tyrosine-phosphatase n=1 Tax=Arthrobacter crystallopoietes BAB-32 TaxID=1246476 RepID=N1UZH5_9MICC|nr:low molecular weight phosphatase family protein [Arthrobacter crystallopoietes]EMY33189.1 protein-tyrosine-phosphatase [Arthrobacter crystallopoietes BAB-32]
MSFKADKPTVLFVCSTNSGKSQMAAGLMKAAADGQIDVRSGGTNPGSAINGQSAESLDELGIDIHAEVPKPVTAEVQREADVVVILGENAQLEEVDGTRYERWIIDEPSLRGIEGQERMRLVRDDIDARVRELHQRLVR